MLVAQVGLALDPEPRGVDGFLAALPGFGRAAAAAQGSDTRVVIVQSAWEDTDRQIDGVACQFVREATPWLYLSGGRVMRRRPRRLFARVAAMAPDVIHFEGLAFPRLLRALARALPGVPVLAQDHGSRVPRGWRRLWYRWGFGRLDGVAFTARAQAAPFVRAGVLRPTLPVFEVLGVSSRFTPGDQARARELTALDGDPGLLWIANLDANKDPLTALEAVSEASHELPGIRLHMCFRRSPLLARVEARIADDPALRTRVRLLGTLPHPAIEAHMRAADFFIQSSHAEASGVAVVEALACGTTPLVTDIPSFRRMTGNGTCGALVPVGDPRALAAALCAWSARDRAALRQRARAHFEQTLSYATLGAELRAAYRAVRGV